MPSEKKQRAYRYGISAERMAALWLFCKGYRILALRYRNKLGEIDIVAMKRGTLAAVEVKARHSLEACEDSVPPWKQQKIARALEGLLATGLRRRGKTLDLAGCARNIRFDVVWVAPGRWPKHIKDAWRV